MKDKDLKLEEIEASHTVRFSFAWGRYLYLSKKNENFFSFFLP
jgi:hypothetical protein